MSIHSMPLGPVANVTIEPPSNQLAELKSLLLKETDQRLSILEADIAKTDGHLRSSDRLLADTTNVLAEAVALRQQKDKALADALQPVLVDSFHRSIRDDPSVLAESLYPILGPAVRKLVASLFTPDRANPGKPYNIEQVYIIHRETGLLINRTLFTATEAQDGDMVSGMLDAIRSFVRDAFEAQEFDGLDRLTVGDLTVWVEWGPDAIMAVVTRGIVPVALRQSFARGLESIHIEYGERLASYDGDNTDFGNLTDQLELMIAETRADKLREQVLQWRTPVLSIIALVFFLLSTAYWLYVGREWNSLIDELNELPGIVVVSDERSFRHYRITGMRDPLAADPIEYLSQNKSVIDSKHIVTRWFPYQSLDGPIVLARAQQLLSPPASSRLLLQDNNLVVRGVASSHWIVNTIKKLSLVKSVLNKNLIFDLEAE